VNPLLGQTPGLQDTFRNFGTVETTFEHKKRETLCPSELAETKKREQKIGVHSDRVAERTSTTIDEKQDVPSANQKGDSVIMVSTKKRGRGKEL